MKKVLVFIMFFCSVFSSAQVLEKTRIIVDEGASPVLYSLVSIDNQKYSKTPFIYSSIDIYKELENEDYVYYAICKEKNETGVKLSCLNNDLSVRFVFPDVVGKAGRFIHGVSVVNSDKWGLGGSLSWGAISRQGEIIIPITHEYVEQKGDRLICCDTYEQGYVFSVYDVLGKELYSQVFSLPSLGVFISSGNIRRGDYCVLNYTAETTEDRDTLLKALDDCLNLRYSSAIQNLQKCLQCDDHEIVEAAKEALLFIQEVESNYPFSSKRLELCGRFSRDSLKYQYSLVSATGYDTQCSPFYYSRAGIYTDCIGSKEEYYAVCNDTTGQLLCFNQDLSLRFVFPEGTVSASPFTSGLSVVVNHSSKWGAVARDGRVVIPMEHDLVMIRFNRIVAYDETKEVNTITVFDLAGNYLYTQVFRLSSNKQKIVRMILVYADNEISMCHFRKNKKLTHEDALLLAIAKCIRLDYNAASDYLHYCLKSKKCKIREVAKENLAYLNTIIRKLPPFGDDPNRSEMDK